MPCPCVRGTNSFDSDHHRPTIPLTSGWKLPLLSHTRPEASHLSGLSPLLNGACEQCQDTRFWGMVF